VQKDRGRLKIERKAYPSHELTIATSSKSAPAIISAAAAYLRARRPECQLVKARGAVVESGRVYKACLRLDEFYLHDARHTHASLMLKQGVHPKIAQE